jgi:hypothetical protein
LPNPGEEIEEFFPKLTHHKHLMSSVTMKKEALAKQGEIPVKQEEDDNNHSGNCLNLFAKIGFGPQYFSNFHPRYKPLKT